MLRHSWALFALLCACSGGFSPPSANPISPSQQQLSEEVATTASILSGHLYVADAAGVQRFPIVNGVPRTTPDLTYTGVTAPIALDSFNHLYATNGLTVNVYQPGSIRLVRTVHVVSPGSAGIDINIAILTGIRSLAVDAVGHLYVALGVRYCIAGSVGCSGPVFAKAAFSYAANAGGTPKPRFFVIVQCLGAGSTTCFSKTLADYGGFAVAANGDLLAASTLFGTRIYTIASPFLQPSTIRILSESALLHPNGLAIDTSGELYVDNPNGSSSFVSAYPVTASGTPAPNRKILIAGATGFGRGITTGASRLFVPDASGFAYEVSSLIGGTQKPIFRFAVKSPSDVKLGP